MNRKEFLLAAILLFFFCADILCAQEKIGKLIFHVTNIQHNRGKVCINLFGEDDPLPKKPFKRMFGEILDGKSTISFDSLSYGEYAAIAFHDENSNGELDHRWGLPNEPLGFSNNWKLSLFSGMPSFKKLKFGFTPENNQIEIVLP